MSRPTSPSIGRRPRASASPRADIDNALYDAFGQRQVSTIYTSLNQYHVIMEVAPQYAQSPASLDDIYVPARGTATTSSTPLPSRDPTTGNAVNTAASAMVPLGAFSHFAEGSAPTAINHQNASLATTISFNLADGKSLSDAQRSIEEDVADIGMPTSVHGSFPGHGAHVSGVRRARSRCSSRRRCWRSTSCWAFCTRATCIR